jgi:hypothetical protein
MKQRKKMRGAEERWRKRQKSDVCVTERERERERERGAVELKINKKQGITIKEHLRWVGSRANVGRAEEGEKKREWDEKTKWEEREK